MQNEIFRLANRLSALEVKHGEFTVMHEHTNAKLEILEALLVKNQDTLTSITLQLATSSERVKTLKATLITLASISTAVCSLHLKPIFSIFRQWIE